MFALRGIEIAPCDDTMLMSYVLDAGRTAHGLDALAQALLRSHHDRLQRGHRHGQIQGHASTASTSTRPPNMPPRTPTSTLRLWQVLKPRLAAEHVTTVYETLERPLVPVLARMERRGISIDRQVLSRLSRRVRPARRRARGRDPGARRRAAQSRQPEAARRHPVRQDRAARRHQDQDRRWSTGARVLGGAGRAGPRRCRRRFSTGGRSPS